MNDVIIETGPGYVAAARAEAARDASAANATTATTQAGIATTQAGIATTQAGTATTQAGIATTQAGIATTQATAATEIADAFGGLETIEGLVTDSETARDEAVAARDAALAGIFAFYPDATAYANVAAGIAGAADGALFTITVGASVLFAPLYRRVGSSARFLGWAPNTLNGVAVQAETINLRALANRAQYEYDFRISYDGRKIPNMGTRADFYRDPDNQMLASAPVLIDADGVSTTVRRVWPAGEVNALGYAECVEYDMTSSSSRFWIAQRVDFAGMAATNITVFADVRVKTGTQPVIIGSSSDASGERTTATLTTTTQRISVDMVNWGSASTYDIAIRPTTGATYSHTIVVERCGIYPTGSEIPSLEEWRANWRAGHAFASPLAFSGAIPTTEGAFVPSTSVRALNIDLRGEAVEGFHMSCYVNIPSLAAIAAGAQAMGFQMDDKAGANHSTLGGFYFAPATGSVEYVGSLYAYGGPSNKHVQEVPDTIIPGAGWTRLDVQVSEDGSQARMRPNDTADGPRRYEIYINGVEQTDVRCAVLSAGLIPRILNIGGNRSNFPDNAVASGQQFPGQIMMPRLSLNAARLDENAIMAQMLDDMARGRGRVDTPLFHVVTEGDSTSRFSGAPTHWYSRELAGSRRMFTNLSQGGRYFSSDILTNDNGNVFNGPNVIAMRRSVLAKSVRDLNCPLTAMLYLGGENNDTHLDPPADAFAEIKDLIMADIAYAQAFDPSRTVVSALQTVRPSGANGPTSESYLRRDAFNDYLRGLFTVTTSNPYVFKTSNIATTGFGYMIDLDAWPPASDTETFTDWFDCLNDSIANGGNTVISADEQHWQGTTGGKKCAEQVYSPALTIMAADNGLTL